MKNRFGPINEIGVFEMLESGLNEVRDPSMHFISHRGESLIGSALISTLEGARPLIVEMQALVSPSNFGMPRQRATGFDINRMVLKLAVLEKTRGFNFSNYDVFVNVIGGIKISEPASDLGMCLAIVSSFREKPLFPDTVFIGEVGLTSEVRGVAQIESRIKEVFRLGLKRCVVPSVGTEKLEGAYEGRLIRISTLKQAVDIAFSGD
ncbi:MAG: magnesium chelatase domain-containing protein [Candidatus Omnitrophota bacterium]